ncbi:hypothetical protein Hanom_Chr06g00571791 [Helianthus anomalus]
MDRKYFQEHECSKSTSKQKLRTKEKTTDATKQQSLKLSTITAKRKSVVPLPGCPSRGTCLVVQVSLTAQTSVFLASRCQSTKLSVFVNRVADPVDPWVVTDSSMCWVHQDHFKVLVRRVLHYRL